MRKILQISEIVGCLAFILLLVGSFVSEQWILDSAREAITVKVVSKANVGADLTEEALRSPLTSRLLSAEQIQSTEAEIALYRQNPTEYVSAVTGSSLAQVIGSEESDDSSSLAAKFVNWRKQLRDYFRDTFEALLLDLRIFFLSTAAAFGVAAYLLRGSDELDKQQLAISGILALAAGYSVLGYLDQNWFFSILLNSYFGWFYPLGIVLTFGWLLYMHKQESVRSDA